MAIVIFEAFNSAGNYINCTNLTQSDTQVACIGRLHDIKSREWHNFKHCTKHDNVPLLH